MRRSRSAASFLREGRSGGRGDLSTQHPKVVHVPTDGLRRKAGGCQMLDEGPETSQQLFTRWQVFFQSHPRARPVVQIAAVGGSIGGRRWQGGAVYCGGLRLPNHPCHGTDHDSKPLPSPSGIRLPPRPLRPPQEKHRSGRPTAGGFGGGLLGVPPASTGL